MIQALLNSFGDVASGSVLLLLLIGTVVGLVTGLIPGLGGVVVLVLLLPFTINMSPFSAFALLVSAYAVFSITGDITSILIGIPAHPECAALVLDGYPMTRRGQAARALGATITSAAVGAVIGAVLLFALIPVLRPVVVKIGSPDLFAIILLGLAFVGSLSGTSVLKGIVSACFGMLLASVGTNSQTGIVRFGFGSLGLLDGLQLVAIALGLFAVPEIMGLHARGNRGVAERLRLDSGVMAGVRDTFKHPLLVVRSSVIGMVMSIIPGLGSAVGQWVAYGQAAQLSRHPERFGSGVIEGVIAPASANNSKEGGSMVPTIAVGVPGSSAMAILLGAFITLGISPGPDMLHAHLDITYFLVIMLVLSNLLGAALSFLFLRPMARVSVVPASILMPFVVAMVVIGTAVTDARWVDVKTLLIIGLVAWVMRKAGWPVVPVILGFVLGGNAENYLWLSVGTYGTSWLTFPLVDTVFALIVVLVVATAWRKMRTRKREDAAAPRPHQQTISRPWRWGSVVVSLAFVGLGCFAIGMSLGWPLEARTFPLAIGIALASLALLEFGVDLRSLLKTRRGNDPDAGAHEPFRESSSGPPASGGRGGTALGGSTENAGALLGSGSAAAVALAEPEVEEETESVQTENLPVWQTLAGYLWFAFACVLSYVVGFLVGLTAFVAIYALATRRKVWWAALMAAVTWGGLYLLFIKVLNAELPISLLGPNWK
jgi:TctA family transporter